MCDLTPLHVSEHLHTQYVLIPPPANPCFFKILPVTSRMHCVPKRSTSSVQKRSSETGSSIRTTKRHKPQTDDKMYDVWLHSCPTHHNVICCHRDTIEKNVPNLFSNNYWGNFLEVPLYFCMGKTEAMLCNIYLYSVSSVVLLVLCC